MTGDHLESEKRRRLRRWLIDVTSWVVAYLVVSWVWCFVFVILLDPNGFQVPERTGEILDLVLLVLLSGPLAGLYLVFGLTVEFVTGGYGLGTLVLMWLPYLVLFPLLGFGFRWMLLRVLRG